MSNILFKKKIYHRAAGTSIDLIFHSIKIQKPSEKTLILTVDDINASLSFVLLTNINF